MVIFVGKYIMPISASSMVVVSTKQSQCRVISRQISSTVTLISSVVVLSLVIWLKTRRLFLMLQGAPSKNSSVPAMEVIHIAARNITIKMVSLMRVLGIPLMAITQLIGASSLMEKALALHRQAEKTTVKKVMV